MTLPWLRSSLALALLSVACQGKLESDIVQGFRLLGADYFFPGDHLGEMVIHEGHVYVANGWSGLGVLRLDPDGELTATESLGPIGFAGIRCTTVALHAPSHSLFCSADRPRESEPAGIWVERFDISEPGHPVRLESMEIQHWAVRDLEVLADTLLIHQFDEGLWTADIAPDGSLSNLVQTPVEGNARLSAVVAGRVVTAFSDPEGSGTQLRLLEPGTWEEVARLSLAGPPLGLSADADGTRVAVGLGSGGMAIVEVRDDGLRLQRTLHPPAVVTHGVLDGPHAYALTLSGAFGYSVDELDGDPRAFGFAPESAPAFRRDGNMLHGLMYEGDLIASDWTWVERWDVDPGGQAVGLDLPRGVHVTPEGPVRFSVRNIGDSTLRAELWLHGEFLFEAEFPGASVSQVELPNRVREDLFADDRETRVEVRIHDPSVAREGEPLSRSSLVFLERPDGAPLPPATDDAFPALTVADRNGNPFTVPLPEGTQTMLLANDCALQFPQLEDWAWHVRNGRDLGRGTPLVLSDVNWFEDGFAARWSLEDVHIGMWGPAAPPGTTELDLFQALSLYEIPSGGASTDYVIDPNGRVVASTRMYRGEWSLTPGE